MTHTNPLRDPQDRRMPRIAGPSAMVIFGVTGDLSRKKVMPAIYDLASRGLLPPGFSLVGYARRDWVDEDFAQVVHDSVKQYARTEFREEVWQQLAEGFRFVQGDFSDDVAFMNLKQTLMDLDKVRGTGGNHAFYLSIPPKYFPDVIGQLKEHGLTDPDDASWRRVVVEKPFGHDLASAQALNATIHEVFPPESVFRIDHYLGKETVQNILAMRFANTMFEPIWNANYVDHVQITMAEDIGIGGRAGYYDGIGAARDVIQNHLMQLMALIAMEEPPSFDARSLRLEKQKVLSSVVLPRRLDLTTAHAQYTEGWAGGEKVLGYKQEQDIPKSSTTETYAAIKLEIETRRWAGRAVLPAARQAAGPAGHRGGRGLQARPAPAVHRDLDRGAHPERAGDPGAARRGDHAAVRLQGARQLDGDPRRQHGLRVRRLLHRVLARGLRAADPRRAARRPAAVPAARGGRAVLEDPGPGHLVLGEARQPRHLRGRHLGPRVRRQDARARRPDLAPAVTGASPVVRTPAGGSR